MSLSKVDAVNIFGSQTLLANAIGIAPSAVSKWPDILPNRTAAEVIGTAIRVRAEIPPLVLHKFIDPDLIVSN